MRKVMTAVVVVALTVGSVVAAERDDVMAVVKQLVDSANKGDMKALEAVVTDEMSIIDEFAPYEWHGPGAFTKWLADYDADLQKNGITDVVLGTGKPRHVDITGDRAYVVVPAWYTYKQNGKSKKQSGATWTLTLQKGNDGWRITGWCWAKP